MLKTSKAAIIFNVVINYLDSTLAKEQVDVLASMNCKSKLL